MYNGVDIRYRRTSICIIYYMKLKFQFLVQEDPFPSY